MRTTTTTVQGTQQQQQQQVQQQQPQPQQQQPQMRKAVCCLHVCTAGQQGQALGSDETETVLLAYALIDPTTNEVIGVQEYVVRPSSSDLNANFLSEQVLAETRLTEAAVKTSGLPLDKAIGQFESFLRTVQIPGTCITFITDGQLPLRQALHPETSRRDLELPNHYFRFADLRKDVARFYGSSHPFTSISDILIFLDIPHTADTDFYAKEVKAMMNIVQRLINDGHKFTSVETVNLVLEPGICSKNEEVDSNCIVRARGLPWQSSDQDIAKFFRGLNVAKGGVALCLSSLGRRNGEALVRFTCSEHREMALKRHKHHIGQRYIEVYRASGEDFVNVAGGSNNEAQAFLTRGAQVIIRMRGLPYDCTAKQVIEFFEAGDPPCSVMDGEEGVLFVRKPDGRSTGDAFVLFKEESDSSKAIARHRELIGTRYIELFRSTTAEVQQVLNRTMETYESPAPLIAPLPSVPLLPQHIITSGTRKDCIRLRGLPYEAQVEHILEFLGEHAKRIVFQGVHMVYNSQGQPSGEAFIQMDSEASAYSAAHLRHHRYMTFGKKQRYIEVFQCSGEDMNLVLTGGLAGGAGGAQAQAPQQQQQQAVAAAAAAAAVAAAAAPQLSPVAKALLSPGGTVQLAHHHPLAVAGHYGPPGAGPRFAACYPGPPPPGPPPPQPPPPPLLYWPYPSPPVSPPPPHPATLLIMRHDNYVEHWGVDYMSGAPAGLPPQLGMHSAAA